MLRKISIFGFWLLLGVLEISVLGQGWYYSAASAGGELCDKRELRSGDIPSGRNELVGDPMMHQQ